MLNSRQRAQLRGMANGYEPIIHIGKEGISDALIKQVSDALEARELIKATVLNNASESVRYFADNIAKATSSDVVQVIGSRFILYRMSNDKDKRKIVLVK